MTEQIRKTWLKTTFQDFSQSCGPLERGRNEVNMSAPEPQVISAEQLEKQGFNQRQIKALQYIEEKGQITNSDYQTLYSVKKRQASEDLRELVEKELVVKIGSTGKGTHYVLKGQ